MKKQMILTLSVMLVFLLAGCDIIANANPPVIPEETDPQPEDEEGETIAIRPEITGNAVTMIVGDTLVVEIPTIPSEGFEWIVQDLDTSVLLQEGSAVYKRDTRSADAAGGLTYLTFTAIGPGKINLSMVYASEASEEMPSLSKKSLGVSVTVRGAGGETIAIRPEITGMSVSLIVGDTLVVEIPTIPSEGFEWIVQDLDTSILVQEGSAVYKRDTRSADAAGGLTYLTFTAVGPGKINLSLAYASGASEEMPALEKNSLGVSVTVRSASE